MYTKEVSGCFLLLSTEPPWLKEYLSKRWSADHLAEIAKEKNPPARYGVTERTLRLELYMISMHIHVADSFPKQLIYRASRDD